MPPRSVHVRLSLYLLCHLPSPDPSPTAHAVLRPSAVCVICNGPGDKRCGRCGQVTYCSRAHQALHWSRGHRAACGQGGAEDAAELARARRAAAFAESSLAMEEEDLPDAVWQEICDLGAEDDDSDSDEDDAMDADTPAPAPAPAPALPPIKKPVDPCFLSFQRRISEYPTQVLRYARIATSDPTPLWVSKAGRPTSDEIGPCAWCGTPRRFEFQVRTAPRRSQMAGGQSPDAVRRALRRALRRSQIMSQAIRQLAIDDNDPDSIDWGTLLVYTCPNNCSAPNAAAGSYRPERVWRQQFSAEPVDNDVLSRLTA